MRSGILVCVAALAVTTGGCARDTTAVDRMTRAADPTVRVPASAYSSVISGTVPYAPVGPKGWEELNRRVGPKS